MTLRSFTKVVLGVLAFGRRPIDRRRLVPSLALVVGLLLSLTALHDVQAGTTTTRRFNYDAGGSGGLHAELAATADEGLARPRTGPLRDYNPAAHLARTNAAFGAEVLAPRAIGAADDIVPYDPRWPSRQISGQNLPGSSGWAVTPGGRTLSVHAAERTFLGGPGRAPIDPGLIDDILSQGTRVAYRGR